MSLKQLLINGEIFDGECVHSNCMLLIDGENISELTGQPQNHDAFDQVIDLQGRLLAPGLIDIQVNGGGGVLFNAEPTVEALQVMLDAHRRFGSTSIFPTFISDKDDMMRRAVNAVDSAITQGLKGIAGIHLEGPYLNTSFKGVHDASAIRSLDDAGLSYLSGLELARILITVAPETLPNGAIKALSQAGAVVFAGHSAASYEQATVALKEGLSGFTHLYNAMTPLVSRAPGLVGAALDDANSYFGVIADGYHVHPASLRIAIAAKPRGKAILVTDAMSCVGTNQSEFSLYGETVLVKDGRCLTSDGTLAGSALGLIDAVRNTAHFGGVDKLEALRMASKYPAEAMGMSETYGKIAPGCPANLIELNADFRVVRNWLAGSLEEY